MRGWANPIPGVSPRRATPCVAGRSQSTPTAMSLAAIASASPCTRRKQRYAGSNPIINLDPSGLSTLSMCARPENVLASAAAGIGSSGSAGTSSSGFGAAGVAAPASLARDGAKTQDDCPLQDMCEKIHATIRTILAVTKKRYRGYAPGWHGPVHCSANRKDVMGGAPATVPILAGESSRVP